MQMQTQTKYLGLSSSISILWLVHAVHIKSEVLYYQVVCHYVSGM